MLPATDSWPPAARPFTGANCLGLPINMANPRSVNLTHLKLFLESSIRGAKEIDVFVLLPSARAVKELQYNFPGLGNESNRSHAITKS